MKLLAVAHWSKWGNKKTFLHKSSTATNFTQFLLVGAIMDLKKLSLVVLLSIASNLKPELVC